MAVPAASHASDQTSPRRSLATLLFAALVAASLASGIGGGLLRAGIAVADSAWAGNALLHHAALMLCGFLGTVICIERAVALKWRPAFAAPLASGLAGLLLLAGQPALAALAWIAAGVVFVLANLAIVRRQTAAHTVLLLCASICWLAANLAFFAGAPADAVIAAWFLFIVATIAAERLELTRLAQRPSYAAWLLFADSALAAGGAVLAAHAPVAGGVLYGCTLVALALWLGTFDIARRTVFTQGLGRYMAVCLLAGYAWLAIAGAAWSLHALGTPVRDVALHALGLGFIVSMVMAHAPVILPAVTGLRVTYTPLFYLPVALLHASLVLRFIAAPAHATAALLNAGAIVLFALTLATSAVRARRAHRRAFSR